MTMRRFLAAGLAAALLAGGCSRSGPSLGIVRGKVTNGSKPVSSGSVVFENRTEGVAQTAILEPDGSYEMKTHQRAGLPVGSYKVAIYPGRMLQPGEAVPLAGKGGTKPKPPATDIPLRFHRAKTSPLKAEVEAGENPPFDFDLAKAR